MIAISSRDNLVSVSVLGEFTHADFQEFEQQVLHNIQFEGGVYLLMDLRDMVGYTLDVAWDELRFCLQHRYDYRKIALVTASEWQVWLAWITKAFVDAEVQAFDDPWLALAWLNAS